MAASTGDKSTANADVQATPVVQKTELDADELLKLVQDWRISQGLPEYKVSEELCQIANVRINEIQSDFSHERFISRYKNRTTSISENLGKDAYTEDSLLNAWIDSASHLEILKMNYSKSCISTSGTYAVQIFSY